MQIYFLLVVVAVVIGIVNNHPDVRRAVDEAWQRVSLPYPVIKLQMQPPDANLIMPVEGVARARVADTWFAPRPGGRKHHGQDIFARKGTPVLSATDGFVVRLTDRGIGGIAVFVAGAGGRTYYYAHLDRYAAGIETGRKVNAGQLIGYVGNTGNAVNTPPHLHFGVYSRSGPVNPLPLIDGVRAAFTPPPPPRMVRFASGSRTGAGSERKSRLRSIRL